MASFNRVILLGNVTREIELKQTPNGTSVVDIGLAVNDRVKRSGNWCDDTTFVEVTLFGRTAEVAGEYLSKGQPCLIEGRLKLETWEKDGQKRSKLKVIGEKLQLLGKKNESAAAPPKDGPQGVPPGQAKRAREHDTTGEAPF